MSPRLHRFASLGPHGFHRIAYAEWGDARNPHVVVCVHGLTRNSRDFDELAQALAERCRVVCMDVAGRGDSDWLEHKEDYGFPLYLADSAALLARVSAPPAPCFGWFASASSREPRIDWVGTSMGGLIGMMLAAKSATPIRRLVLNDVGPIVPWAALLRLKLSASGAGLSFSTIEEVERHLRDACASFGPLSEAQWRRLAEHGARRRGDGRYVLAYDPAIVTALRSADTSGIEFGGDFLAGVDLWPIWDAVRCPVLVLRGGDSDLLTEATVRQMCRRGPPIRVVEFPGIGHAPWLKSAEQIAPVREFLLAPEVAIARTEAPSR